MDGELITDLTVWFGIREPEWWPEDEDEFEDRAILSRNIPKRNGKAIRIRIR